MKVMGSDILKDKLESVKGFASPAKRSKFLDCHAGFTLVELLIVVSILGVLVTLAMPAYSHLVRRAENGRAISEIRTIEKDIVAFVIETNSLPNTLNDVGRGGLLDPWGNAYQYLNIANGGAPRQDFFTINLNADFDLYSLGVDGLSAQDITDPKSLDDLVRAADGGWVGPAEIF